MMRVKDKVYLAYKLEVCAYKIIWREPDNKILYFV